MLNLFLLILLALAPGPDVRLNKAAPLHPDTVQHRYAVFKLPDETSIEYWFGQMTVSNARGSRFLHFNEAVLNGYLMESEPFEVYISDSLFFRRSIVFSNPAKRLANKDVQIKPDSLVFNAGSMLRFIVEIEHIESKYRTYLDTVSCFVNARGELRFRNSRFDTPFRRHDISMHAGTSRVLVRVDTSGIHAPLVLEEIRHLDQQSPMDPYQTSMWSHQITVNGFDVDSIMSQYRSATPPPK